MAEFPALPLWTDALIGDTYHLTPAEFGAYLRLLIAAWRTPDCKLPTDDAKLGRMVGDPKNWWRWRDTVMAFWTLGEDGKYFQKRLLDERSEVSRRVAQRSSAGRASALKRKHRGSTSVGTGRATKLQREANTHTHTQNHSTPLEPNGSISPKGAKTKKRGTRLPSDWMPTEADVAYARKKGMTDEQIRHFAEEFRNYWAAASGRNAAKLDWPATWKNRVLALAENGRIGNAASGQPAAKGNRREPASYVEQALRYIDGPGQPVDVPERSPGLQENDGDGLLIEHGKPTRGGST